MDSRGLFVRHIQQAVAAYEGGVERGVSNSWNATVCHESIQVMPYSLSIN